MKYLKYFFSKIIHHVKTPLIIYILMILLVCLISSDDPLGFIYMILPNDYCNLTDVDYTAILHDDPNGKACVEITEYLTFDVHASSKSNTFKELWRELPEDNVDGLDVTYDVKSVTQILDDGEEIPYIETSKMYWEDEDYTQSSTMRWHHSNGSGTYPDNDESLLIYIPWTYRDKLTFKVVYTMNNAALKYRDCSELYLSMYSGNTITKLNSYKAQILIPNEIMPSTYYTYSFGTAKSRLPYTESDYTNLGYHTFSINLNKSDLKFNYHNRYIEFCLLSYGIDKHIFTKYAPNNMYSGENALEECIEENEYYETQNQRFNAIKSFLLITSIIATLLIIKNTKQKYKKIHKKYNLYKPEIDYQYFRDIPSDLDPMFASELVFWKDTFNENKAKKEEYAAILLSLIRKQYVKVNKVNDSQDWTDYNTQITLEPLRTVNTTPDFIDSPDYSPEPVYITINENTGDTLETLSTSERLYLELLERHTRNTDNSIILSKLQKEIDRDYEYTNSFVKDMYRKPIIENGAILGYFQQTDYDAPKKELEVIAKSSLTRSLILLILVNLFSYFTPLSLSFGAYTLLGLAYMYRFMYLTIKANNLILFTQYGVDEQAKWYGLYNFLNSDTLLNEKEIPDLVLWEKYLIYATAFGISEKVINALKIHAVELNIDNSAILNHYSYIHSNLYHNISRSFGHSIHTSSRGGGFGGHGYGGGGRGRRRRWRRPLILTKKKR